MGGEDRRACDPQGCANLQVMRKEIELYANTLKSSMDEARQCITATGEAQKSLTRSISDLQRVIEGQAVALQAGTREFNIINDEVDHLRDGLQDVKTRVAVLESGGTPGNKSAAGWGATLGGIVSAIAWAIGKFFGGQ